jgi:hypothetical protein
MVEKFLAHPVWGSNSIERRDRYTGLSGGVKDSAKDTKLWL